MSAKEDQNDRTQVQVHDPLVGTTFDRRFHIDFRIAVGGFGAIYHATHNKSGHQFALKILHPRLANDPGVIARFRREGETLTRLRDPHTIIAYELGETSDGTLFIVMELLHGESLYERYRANGPLEWRRMAKIARGVCSSLIEAHALGIVHRDLKPTNINLERNDDDPDFAKVLDFGIAKILRDSDIDSSDLTNAGQMIGTLDYMSPEQMVGGACTGQTDIYTLGIVMYEMIAGRRPFADANSPAAVLAAMLRTTPKRLTAFCPVPHGIDRVIQKCLEREAEHRWATVEELASALDAVLRGEDVLADRDEVTRTLALTQDDESTVFDARRPSLVSGSLAAQADPTIDLRVASGDAARSDTSDLALGEAATEPAPPGASGAGAGLSRASRSSNTAISPPPSPPQRSSSSSIAPRGSQPAIPPPLFNIDGPRKRPTGPPPIANLPPAATSTPYPATGVPSAAPFREGSGGVVVRQQGASQSGGMATPLSNTGLAIFPPQPAAQPSYGAPRHPPTPPPPMAGQMGMFPPTAVVPPLPPGPGMPGFDMAQIAARDAAVRRIVWIFVLVLAAVVGIAIALR